MSSMGLVGMVASGGPGAGEKDSRNEGGHLVTVGDEFVLVSQDAKVFDLTFPFLLMPQALFLRYPGLDHFCSIPSQHYVMHSTSNMSSRLRSTRAA